MNDRTHEVVLEGLPVILFDSAVTYLADMLRECQLVLVDIDQGATVDATMADLALGLVPDLEELRDLFRDAGITTDGRTYRVTLTMVPSVAATLAHLQMQLVQLRFIGRLGGLLVGSDPEVTQFLAWVWDEAADQINGRAPRPYRGRTVP